MVWGHRPTAEQFGAVGGGCRARVFTIIPRGEIGASADPRRYDLTSVTAVHSSRRPSYLNAAMITPCARVMAVATFATTRCGSFLYGGSRFARTGAKQFAALHSSAQVERTTKDHESLSRGNADGASLDSLLISTNPDLVVDHMKARRMGEDSVEAVHRIGGTSHNAALLLLQTMSTAVLTLLLPTYTHPPLDYTYSTL